MNMNLEQIETKTFESISRILKSIAHPVKLEILYLLSKELVLDVSSICKHIGADCEISMMSHHLSKMKDNGILSSRKEGKRVFYQIADQRVLKIFDCMRDEHPNQNIEH